MILKRAAAEKLLGRKIKAPAWKKWYLLSADGTKNLGGYKTKKEAVARERAVQYFKRNPDIQTDYNSVMAGELSAKKFADMHGLKAVRRLPQGRFKQYDCGSHVDRWLDKKFGRGKWSIGESISWDDAKVGDRVEYDAWHYAIVIEPDRRWVESCWGVDGYVFQHPADIKGMGWSKPQVIQTLVKNPRERNARDRYAYRIDFFEVDLETGDVVTPGAPAHTIEFAVPASWQAKTDWAKVKEKAKESGYEVAGARTKGKYGDPWNMLAMGSLRIYTDQLDGARVRPVHKMGALGPVKNPSWAAPLGHKVDAMMTVEELEAIADPNIPLRRLAREDAGRIRKIKEDVRLYGLVNPIIVKKGRGIEPMIWDGHHRLLAAKQLGIEKVPVTYYIANPGDFWQTQHDWDQVLIAKGGKKKTRGQILEHYKKVEKKIWPFLKGQTVMVYIGTGRNRSILRRKGPDGNHIKLTKLKGIDDPHSFEYWIHRRVIEFHPVLTGKTTPLVWVDLDPKFTKANEAKLRRKMRAAVPRIKAVLRKEFGATQLHVYTSGKRGIHVEGNLPRATDADKLRRSLRAALVDEFSDDKTFTTKVPKAGQIRLDTNLIKHLGSIRAPYSMSVMGRAKLPMKASKAKVSRRKNPEPEELLYLTGEQYERLKAMASVRRAQEWDEDPDLEHIGIGGERVVYGIKLEGRWLPFALKVDQGERLHRQTEEEIKCLVKAKSSLAPEIFDWDQENYRWIEMELLTPLDEAGEGYFEEISGIPWDDWSFAFETYGGFLTDWAGVEKNIPETPKARKFLATVKAFVEECELATSELGLVDNWGVTFDGKRLKPLDLGY